MANGIFKSNNKYPTIPAITNDLKSHTAALLAMQEAISIHERRTKDLDNSFVRVKELVDLGLITLVGGDFNVIGVDLSSIADVGDLTGASEGDFLRFRSGEWLNDQLDTSDILEVFVTQHEAALTIDWSQLVNIPALVDDIGDLSDPNDDRILFWDDSAGSVQFLDIGKNLTLSGTVLAADDHYLDDLIDVNANYPNSGDVLTWDGYQWVNDPIPFIPQFLDDLQDVDAPYANSGDVLTWDGYAWVPDAPSGGGGGGTSFADPTGTVGLAVVPGVATTAMRSDAAPPLSQAITPTWTGKHIWQNDTTPIAEFKADTNKTFRLRFNNNSAAGNNESLYEIEVTDDSGSDHGEWNLNSVNDAGVFAQHAMQFRRFGNNIFSVYINSGSFGQLVANNLDGSDLTGLLTSGTGVLKAYGVVESIGNASAPIFRGTRFKNTITSKTPVESDDYISIFIGGGYYSSSGQTDGTMIACRAAADWSNSETGAYIQFWTSPTGMRDGLSPVILITSAGHLRSYNDNQEIQIGRGTGTGNAATGDLRLTHDGTNSIIRNDTGDLKFMAGATEIFRMLSTGFDMKSGVLTLLSAPPSSAGDTGKQGTITWDSGFIYICTATNTWKRVAIATF